MWAPRRLVSEWVKGKIKPAKKAKIVNQQSAQQAEDDYSEVEDGRADVNSSDDEDEDDCVDDD